MVRIVRERFLGNDFERELFAVVGDLNDTPTAAPLAPQYDGTGLVNALERIPEETDRTEWHRSANSVSQLDHLLLSPAQAAATDGVAPVIERRGVSFARGLKDGGIGPRESHYERADDDPNAVTIPFDFARFADVTPEQYAPDHCPITLTM